MEENIMSKSKSWTTEKFHGDKLYVALFTSRNKDNKGLTDFKERRKSFIFDSDLDYRKLKERFYAFADAGVPGEMSRMYVSVNARDPEKVYKQLMHFLFDNPAYNLCNLEAKLAGIAAQSECAMEKMWMFDFDIPFQDIAVEFCDHIKNDIDETVVCSIHRSPKAFSIVCSHGFDMRKLDPKWQREDITLKRDDLRCILWETKEK
jgi:hypothetical protein